MDDAALWVYLDDEGGRQADLPLRLIAEGQRLAQATGWRCCGIVRHPAVAARLQAGGRGFELDGLLALGADPECPDAAIAVVAERLAACVAAAPDLRVLVLPGTTVGADLAARVAARLGRPLLSQCVDLEWSGQRLIGRRAVCSGRAHQMVSPTVDPPWVVTLDPQVLEAPAAPAPHARVATLATGADAAPMTAVARVWRIPAAELGVLDAQVVLSVGRGVAADALAQVHELAALLHAAVGGSREAVFGGLVQRERQVGASGKWIAPRVYVALGISGSTYHLMGIREARHVVAINTDPTAPIMARAEVGIVADVATLVPALVQAARPAAVTEI